MKVGREIVVLMSMLPLWGFPVLDIFGPNTFQEACHKGAKARVVFRVLNDFGAPVPGARVNVFFDMADRGEGRRVDGITNTNGICVVEEKTVGVLKIEVSCDGYYGTKEEICFIAMGHEHEVKNGKWQPWEAVKNIVLLPIKNPCALIADMPEWKRTRELKKWIGFDLIKYDFVMPYGKGVDTDMEVMFDSDGVWNIKDYTGMALKIRFPEKFAGGYYANKTPGSEYVGVYQADTNGVFIKEFTFFERVRSRNKRGYATSYERHLFDPSKVLVVRSRCKLNEDGTLKTAHYFQLDGIKFSGDSKRGAALLFLSIYNPLPNDTNLEPR